MLLKGMLTVAAVLLAFSLAGAEMYQWVDDKGVVTFKDSPPPPSKKHKKVKKYSEDDFGPAPAVQPAPAPRSGSGGSRTADQTAANPTSAKKQRFNGTVELYVTDWCGYCKQAISYLKSKNIPYVTYDIEKDSAAKKRHEELGGRGVPLIIIGSNKMSGFSAKGLEYYLENSK